MRRTIANDDASAIRGRFQLTTEQLDHFKTVPCNDMSNYTVTHTSDTEKSLATFMWIPPAVNDGSMALMYVVESLLCHNVNTVN